MVAFCPGICQDTKDYFLFRSYYDRCLCSMVVIIEVVLDEVRDKMDKQESKIVERLRAVVADR